MLNQSGVMGGGLDPYHWWIAKEIRNDNTKTNST